MSSSGIYKEKFQDLKKLEEAFATRYEIIMEQIKDPFILEKLNEVHEDEKKHISIAKSFLEIAKDW